jgi:hypothetical protein
MDCVVFDGFVIDRLNSLFNMNLFAAILTFKIVILIIVRYGKNIIPVKQPDSFFFLIHEALKDKVMILLIMASIVSIVLGVLPWTTDSQVYMLYLSLSPFRGTYLL